MFDDLRRYVLVDSRLSAVILDYLSVDYRKVDSESGVGARGSHTGEIMKPTSQQGCTACRQVIYSGSYDWRTLPCSIKRHAYLYRCEACGTNWELGERAAYEISADEAAAILEDAHAGR
jgi:hypothetical protein